MTSFQTLNLTIILVDFGFLRRRLHSQRAP